MNINIKRYNGSGYDVLYPSTKVEIITNSVGTTLQALLDDKVNSSLLGIGNGVAQLDAGAKLLYSQIPEAILSGMKLKAVLNASTQNLDDLASQLDDAETDLGNFWIVTVEGTIDDTLTTAKWESNTIDDGVDAPPSILLEPGDWVVCTSWGATLKFSVINNSYGKASDLESGVVELATNAEANTGTDAIRALTPANLAYVLAQKAYAISTHDHDAVYLGISNNAVSATKLLNERTISLSGDATGSIGFDGTGNVIIPVTVSPTGHEHGVSKVRLERTFSGFFTGALNGDGLDGFLDNLEISLDEVAALVKIGYFDTEALASAAGFNRVGDMYYEF